LPYFGQNYISREFKTRPILAKALVKRDPVGIRNGQKEKEYVDSFALLLLVD